MSSAMITCADLVAHLQMRFKPDALVTAVFWTVDDVVNEANDHLNIELTDRQAKAVLYRLRAYHDSEVGINWISIQSTIESVLADEQSGINIYPFEEVAP